jgi:hypothetical protein
MIKPLHVATVGGRPLRFFRTPLDDGRPDLVWHAVDDLYQCLGLSKRHRKIFLRQFRKAMRTVATAEGVITIAPHFMAQGAIDAMVEVGQTTDFVRTEIPSGEHRSDLRVPKRRIFRMDESRHEPMGGGTMKLYHFTNIWCLKLEGTIMKEGLKPAVEKQGHRPATAWRRLADRAGRMRVRRARAGVLHPTLHPVE